MADFGNRLSQDEWLVSNTLQYVFYFLDTSDILNCSMVCKLWNKTISSDLFKTIRVTNCQVKWKKLTVAMRKYNTKHLKLVKCEYYGRIKFFGFYQLHTLVISDLKTNFFEHLVKNCTNLRVLHISLRKVHRIEVANVKCRKIIDLSFIRKLKHLKDFRISCNYQTVINKSTVIEHLNLKHLWVLDVHRGDMGGLDIDVDMWVGRAGKKKCDLQTLGLGNCKLIPETCKPLPKIMPFLTTLCLYDITVWFPLSFFRNISTLKKLNTLILISVIIVSNFEEGIKLCSNLDSLIIVPKSVSYKVPMCLFNERIYNAVTQIRLKTLKWGFDRTFMRDCVRLFHKSGVVPIGTNCLVTINELQTRLKDILVDTEVVVEENVCFKQYRGFDI